MATAIFLAGDPQMYDYVPGAAVTAGDVVLESDTPIVIHRDYDPADADATINPQGAYRGGIYTCTAPTGYTADYGVAAYWNASTGITANQNDTHFGRFVKPKATNDVTVEVLHEPVIGLADES